jgi:hypothetical protein
LFSIDRSDEYGWHLGRQRAREFTRSSPPEGGALQFQVIWTAFVMFSVSIVQKFGAALR